MTDAGQPLIQIEELTKVFYTDEVETHALSGVHLGIGKGEYVAISGPSGCGKSTLLSIIGLLDTPTGGKFQLNGIHRSPAHFHRNAYPALGIRIELEQADGESGPGFCEFDSGD